MTAAAAAVCAVADCFDGPWATWATSGTWVASMDLSSMSLDSDRTFDCCALDCNCQPLVASMAMNYRLQIQKPIKQNEMDVIVIMPLTT